MRLLLITLLFSSLILPYSDKNASASDPGEDIRISFSETLDLWRNGRFEALYDRLARHGKMPRERFVSAMKETPVKPACCWQKLDGFRLVFEKRGEVTVRAKVGLEYENGKSGFVTREFRFISEGNDWKLQLGDIAYLAEISGRKKRR